MEVTPFEKNVLTKVLNIAVNKYRDQRFNKLISKLSDSELKISQKEIDSDNFISCFLKTSEAIDKSTTNNKVNFLIKIFVNGINSKLISELPDLYHEAITIFSELSFREITVLSIAKKHLPANIDPQGIEVAEKNLAAITEISNELGLEKTLSYVLLSRLQRTGFIRDSALLGNTKYFVKTELLNEIYSYIDLRVNK